MNKACALRAHALAQVLHYALGRPRIECPPSADSRTHSVLALPQ